MFPQQQECRAYPSSAAAPEIISVSSVVMAACRDLHSVRAIESVVFKKLCVHHDSAHI